MFSTSAANPSVLFNNLGATVPGVCFVQSWPIRSDADAIAMADSIGRDPTEYLSAIRILRVPGVDDLRDLSRLSAVDFFGGGSLSAR